MGRKYTLIPKPTPRCQSGAGAFKGGGGFKGHAGRGGAMCRREQSPLPAIFTLVVWRSDQHHLV